jgi:hypothetical protein
VLYLSHFLFLRHFQNKKEMSLSLYSIPSLLFINAVGDINYSLLKSEQAGVIDPSESSFKGMKIEPDKFSVRFRTNQTTKSVIVEYFDCICSSPTALSQEVPNIYYSNWNLRSKIFYNTIPFIDSHRWGQDSNPDDCILLTGIPKEVSSLSNLKPFCMKPNLSLGDSSTEKEHTAVIHRISKSSMFISGQSSAICVATPGDVACIIFIIPEDFISSSFRSDNNDGSNNEPSIRFQKFKNTFLTFYYRTLFTRSVLLIVMVVLHSSTTSFNLQSSTPSSPRSPRSSYLSSPRSSLSTGNDKISKLNEEQQNQFYSKMGIPVTPTPTSSSSSSPQHNSNVSVVMATVPKKMLFSPDFNNFVDIQSAGFVYVQNTPQ